MKCPRCAYDWDPKVPNPKECPRCKARLDYEPGPVGAPKIGKKGGVKEMASKNKLPWATALILIVAAVAVGTWAIIGTTSVETPPPPPPTGGEWTRFAVWGAGTPATSGIENVYFMNHGFGDDADDNFFHLQTVDTEDNGPKENENIYWYNNDNAQVLRASGDTISVNADNAFDIVVVYKVHSTQVYNPAGTDNFRIELILSGAIAVEENDNSDVKFCFDNDQSNGGTGSTWGRWVTVFNGGGNGYQITAGSNFSIDNIALHGWRTG